MVTVTTENRNFRKKGFPENLLFMEGEERGGGELENIVWIKYTALPNPACLSARHGCTPLDMAINHLIPEPPLAPIDSSDMIIFPFQTNDAKIMYSAPSYYDSLDGRGRRSDLNVHLSSDKVVLSIHHITSSWKTSRNGIKYPDSDAKLVNLVETRPFLLFHEVPTFLDPGRHGSDLTWLWILIAVVIIVLLLCLLFWFMRRRRDKAVVDGHVDVGRSSSSQPSSLRSSVPSSPTASNASPPYNPGPVGGSAGQSHGSHARSSNKDVPTSSHVPHKSHTHTAPPPPSASLSPRKSGSSKPTSSKRPLSSSSASHKKDRMMIGLSSV